MKKPHKHAALIKQWADDSSLKIQMKHGDIWHDILGDPSWHIDYEYRIKPEVVRYRVALVMDRSKKELIFVDEIERERDFELMHNFIEWKSDWIEVEI